MTRQMTSRTKVGVFAFLSFVMMALAGCGNHNQAGGAGGSGTLTSQQIQQNASKQNQPINNPAGAGGKSTAGTPAAPATH